MMNPRQSPSEKREAFPKAGIWRSLFVIGTLVAAAAWGRPALAADTRNGAKLYATHCLACHGADGRGVLPGAPDFSRSMTLMQPDGPLMSSVRAGRGAMPGFLGILRERDLFDVIAYVRTLV